jgi:hypothetical protein
MAEAINKQVNESKPPAKQWFCLPNHSWWSSMDALERETRVKYLNIYINNIPITIITLPTVLRLAMFWLWMEGHG